MGLYAKLLDGTLTVGQALAYAKQAYYGSLGAIGVYDLKILQQTAFYGLPFWQVTTTGTPTPPPAPTPPACGSIADAATGLEARPSRSPRPSPSRRRTGLGRCWTVTGLDPQVTHYRPIQPRMVVPVGVALRRPRRPHHVARIDTTSRTSTR